MKKFPISDVYSQEAAKLLEARQSVQIVHSTGDIDASGDELEIPFRTMLQRRLPAKYYVGHGHIVDKELKVSPQFDVIIADSSATPILYDGQNGTQYFPYESVYALGEIKSSYYKNSKYVQNFASSVSKLLNEFIREPVDSNYIGEGINLGSGFSVDGTRKIQNLLLSFMIFGAKNDCEPAELEQQLNKNCAAANPNIMCFLDGHIITKSNLIKNDNGIALGAFELDPVKQINEELALVEVNFTNASKSGQALSILMLSIFNHLSKTRLKSPPFASYVESILSSAAHEGQIIKAPIEARP
jgi:hypothetical protein